MKSIEIVDRSTKQALVDLGVRHMKHIVGPSPNDPKNGVEVAVDEVKLTSPGFHRDQMSHLLVEAVVGPKELAFKGVDDMVPVNILHLYPNRVHQVDANLMKTVSEVVERVMAKVFRIEPGHQDYTLEWIPEVKSFCLTMTGAHFEPDITRRLMKVGALVNVGLASAGVLTRA